MKFANRTINASISGRDSSPLLILFHHRHRRPEVEENRIPMVDKLEEVKTEEPLDTLFFEALKFAAINKSVHWIRRWPPQRMPRCTVASGVPPTFPTFIRPNWLRRIILHYGEDAIPETLGQLFAENIYTNVITPAAIFVELQDNVNELSVIQLAAILALLSAAARWVAEKRGGDDFAVDSFPLVVVLRGDDDSAADAATKTITEGVCTYRVKEAKMIASMYSDYLAEWWPPDSTSNDDNKTIESILKHLLISDTNANDK